MELLAGTLMVLDTARDTELETEQPELFATDWRGNAIDEGTRVFWSNNGHGIGKVVKISRDYNGSILLGILWEDRDGWDKSLIGKTSYNIRAYNCTVWPTQDYGY
jgi:hypothetical protein